MTKAGITETNTEKIVRVARWNKKAMISRIIEINRLLDVYLLDKLTMEELEFEFLKYAGKAEGIDGNESTIYIIDIDECLDIENKDLEEIIKRRSK